MKPLTTGPRTAPSTSAPLQDDAIIEGPPSGSLRRWFSAGVDRLAGADPGLTQLRSAAQAILGIVLTVVLVYAFVRVTGGLQLPVGAAPEAVRSATNHALLIVSMMVGGIIAMMAGFVVNDPSPREQLISTLLLPLPMLAAMVGGLLLGGVPIVSLVYLVVLMTAAVYVRRWGPRGFAAGLVAFNGGFLGFFLHRQLHLSDVGWLAADIALGIVASLFVRFVVLRTDREHTLDRMRRSWQARASGLLAVCSESVHDPIARHRRGRDGSPSMTDEALRRRVVRLNESTLIVEAQLVITSPTSARVEAQELFSAELSLTNCARFSAALARVLTSADDAVRVAAAQALDAARAEDWPRARELAGELRPLTGSTPRASTLVRRLALSIDQYAASRARLHRAVELRRQGGTLATFTPAVELNNGFLPGSITVSAAASTTPGRGRFERSTMPPYVRTSIQIAVAATIAVIAGHALSSTRLYWAVLATFLAFMATTNTGEQVRKALFRVTGTAIGIVIGDLLVRVTGGNVWAALPVVLVVLFLGIYLIRVNYTFMVIGVTMMLSLIYFQLGEFSWDLLLLRLAETAIGVGAVVLTVLVVLPLRPQRVLTAGVLLWFQALEQLLDASLARLVEGTHDPLRPGIRTLDASWASLEATAAPLRHATFGRHATQLSEIRAVTSAARFYTRSFADEVGHLGEDVTLPALRQAADELKTSTTAIAARIETGEHGVYMRCSALIDEAVRGVEVGDGTLHRALRDLSLLDGALARLATALDMDVRDHDTSDLLAGEAAAGS